MTGPHVLLSAYQCAPGGGSVSQIGWEWYSRLSRVTPVTLVTHVRNQKALEAFGAPLPGSDIVYINTEWFARPVFRWASFFFPHSEHAVFLLSSADFFLYDAVAVKQLKQRRLEFDLIHAVTPVSPLAVTQLHKLGMPLIVGPWNGGLTTLKGFHELMQRDSQWIYHVQRLRGPLDRLTHCSHRAACVLSATVATDRCLPRAVRSERMIENGVDLAVFHAQEIGRPSPTNPLQVLFVGRLIPAKGISMLIEAAARIRSLIPFHLQIVGAGALRVSLEEQVRQQKLESLISFLGSATHSQVAVLMRRCHLFCLPSIRESGGAVILEAMASGLPVLTVAHGGPGELIDDAVGVALQAANPEQLIQGLAKSLIDAYQNDELWRQRGAAGRLRAEQQYGWDIRIQRAINLYQGVLKEMDELSTREESRQYHSRFSSPKHIN